jgi:hypothetical protein
MVVTKLISGTLRKVKEKRGEASLGRKKRDK